MKLKNILIAGGCLAAALMPAAASADVEKTLAFPGAEGFGRYTTGGRGGAIYHVTNLSDDSGTKGSLRWALAQPGPRTILFDISGTIHLESALKIPENTTIAGQSAPGDGICIADYPVQPGANNIIRFIRFRLGNKYVTVNGANGWDGLGTMDSHDIIVDHCSVSWSIDECLSIYGSTRTTVQWTIVSQSLVNSGHSKGAHGYGGNWGGAGASYHHNLMIHHGSRTPRLGPRASTQTREHMDMRNNVIYNFGGNGCYGGEGMKVNIVNNYYKPGPGSPTGDKGKRIAGVGIRTTQYCTTYPAFSPMLHVWGKYFVDGNVNSKYSDVTEDNWKYGMYNQITASSNDGLYNQEVRDSIRILEPISFTATTTQPADVAFQKVMDWCGVSLHRDWHDALMIKDATDGTATYTGSGLSKGMINTPMDNKPKDAPADWDPFPTLETAELPVDTDGDGMPDEWEIANGLDPKSKNDALRVNAEGYTMIEVYLADIVKHITEAQNADGEVIGDFLTAPAAESQYVLNLDNIDMAEASLMFNNGVTVANNRGSAYTLIDGIMRHKTGQHHILLPAGVEVYAVKLVGKGEKSAAQLGEADGSVQLTELNGETFEKGAKTLPDRKAAEDGVIEHTLQTPARGSLSMTFGVNSADLKEIVLYARAADSAVEELADEVAPTAADDAWYDLTGRRINVENGMRPTLPGLYIHSGKKIVVR